MREERFTVLGIGKRGKSGLAAALALASLGKETLVSESSPRSAYLEETALLEQAGVRLEFGGHSEQVFQADVIVVCPGIKPQASPLEEARRRGVPIWSEIELAYRLSPAPIVAITGTNGKTTTTALVASVLAQGDHRVWVGGNIGIPLVSAVRQAKPNDWVVAEIGAPQLEHIHHFAPKVAVLLNFSEDHLDRYNDMATYQRVKSRLVECQTAADWVVRNQADEWSRKEPSWAHSFPFGASAGEAAPLPDGTWMAGDRIWVARDGQAALVTSREEIPLPGLANLENTLAAVSVGALLGLRPEQIARGLACFPGVEHRLEEVAVVDGVTYINDSSGTNPLSTIRAIEALERPLILIAGGSEKGADFHPLAATVSRKAKLVVLFGKTRQRIAAAFLDLGFQGFQLEEGDLGQALQRARQAAVPGDVILFSPACASFDMFGDFEHRGDTFKELIREMEQRHP
ncbi:MAG: UDP-N-acetylmuramoyl-L-alanine--D-glutamate ligase [Coprothermobacterota bacterium]|nr:UDP-N-acetylmuramoyl-L-alanine--D-glutamate ligase [Coprothermobacterota bacterium]